VSSDHISNYLCLPRLGISGKHQPLNIAATTKQGSPQHWKFSKVHTGPRCAHGFQPSVCYDYSTIINLCRQQAEVIKNRGNEHVRSIGQGEGRHRKYKRLKVGGGQAYGRSSD
jgi:hypothetical protein